MKPEELRQLITDTQTEVQQGLASNRSERSLSQLWQQGAKYPTDVLAEGIGRFFQTMTQTGPRTGFKGFADPAGPIQRAAGQGLAETVIPQTPTQVALVGLQFTPGFQALPFLGRAAMGLATGAGVSQMTGDSPLSGLAQGALMTGAAEVVRGTGAGIHKLTSRQTLGAERRFAERFAIDFGDAIARDVPAFRQTVVDTPKKVFLLRDPNVGLKHLKDTFGRAEDAVKTALNNGQITSPAIGKWLLEQSPNAATLNPQVAQQLATQPVLIDRALSIVKEMKALAWKQPKGALGHSARTLAKEAQGDIIRAVSGADPRVTLQYVQALESYDKGLGYLKLLEDAPWLYDVKSAFISPNNMRSFLRENIEVYPPSKFPALWKSAFPQGTLGAGDVVGGTPNVRIFGPRVGPIPGGAVTLGEKFVSRVERPVPGPSQRRIPSRVGGMLGASAGSALFRDRDAAE